MGQPAADSRYDELAGRPDSEEAEGSGHWTSGLPLGIYHTDFTHSHGTRPGIAIWAPLLVEKLGSSSTLPLAALTM